MIESTPKAHTYFKKLRQSYHEAIRAAYELTKLEGIIPALESAHAIGALDKIDFSADDVVVLTVSGRGDKDIETYLDYEF